MDVNEGELAGVRKLALRILTTSLGISESLALLADYSRYVLHFPNPLGAS